MLQHFKYPCGSQAPASLLGQPLNSSVPKGDIKGFIPQILPKVDLTTDAEYVANLVNVNMSL